MPTAAAAGLSCNPAPGLARVPVTNVAEMKQAIAELLCSDPHGGVDLEGYHKIFQFLPSYRRDIKMMALITKHLYLRHAAIGYVWPAPGPPVGLDTWPDIVEYLQAIQITAANAAVGPVDLVTYFNA